MSLSYCTLDRQAKACWPLTLDIILQSHIEAKDNVRNDAIKHS